MSSVFVSHSSKDASAAMVVVAALERRGLCCWVAPRDIPTGAMYAGCIEKAIQNSEAIALILTEHSGLSLHVLREIQLAEEEDKKIFPIALDGTNPQGNMRYLLCIYQRISATLANIDFAAREVAVAVEKLRVDRKAPSAHHIVDLRSFLKTLTSSSLQQNVEDDTIQRVALDVPLLQDILEGSSNEKRAGETRTLEGFADMLSAVYLLSQKIGMKELQSKLESMDYTSLKNSWARYEDDDLIGFYKEFQLARSILARAEYAQTQGDDGERSFQEGRGRALFMINRVISG